MSERGQTGRSYAIWKHYAPYVLLLLAVVFAYWPSFSVDYYLDDFSILLDNNRLHDVFDLPAIWQFTPSRFVASLTLAANYSVHGDSLFSYHLVNLLIHLGAGFALWALLTALLKSPVCAVAQHRWMRWIPLIATAIFLLHPLQTQAVTYIVQRYASLAAMFYLLSMAAWAWGRVSATRSLYVLAFISMLLALLCKQNAATLPLALVLLEVLFFRPVRARQWAMIVTAVALLASLTCWLLTLPALDLVGVTRETTAISRIDYLATQMGVLWRYIGLFFFIGEQRFEYNIAIEHSFLQLDVLLYAAGHLVLIAAGILLWRRATLLSLGILFYYLAHAVESSFLPIIDVAFEHRSYLPNAGLASVCAVGLAWLSGRVAYLRAGAVITLILLGLLASATYARNQLWADRIGFLSAETRLSPNDQRAWVSLGKELMRAGRFEEALRVLSRAQTIARLVDNGNYRPATLLNMVYALHYTGQQHKALRQARMIPLQQLNDLHKSSYYEVMGRIQLALGDLQAARRNLQLALKYHANTNAAEILLMLPAVEAH